MQELEIYDIESLSCESLMNFLPITSVSEEGDYIHVRGMRSSVLEHAIKKQFKTSRIYNGVFINSSFRYVKFHKFYAVEFVYILNTLIKSGKSNIKNETLVDTIKLMYEKTWLKHTRDETKSLEFNYSKLNELKKKPFDYQLAYIKNFEKIVPNYNLKGMLAELAAGSGKTLLAYFFSVVCEADINIILCPKPTVKQIWVGTLEKEFKRPQRYWDSVDKGTITGKERYIICHYQAIEEVMNAARKIRGKKINIWIDESHNLTEETSGLVKKLYALVKDIEPIYVTHASATPLKARPTEAIPLLKTIDPLFTGEAVDSYVKVFGASKAVALDMLNNRLGIVKFKVTKEQYNKIKETQENLLVSTPNSDKYTLDSIRKLMKEETANYIKQYEKDKSGIISNFRKLHERVAFQVGNKELMDEYFKHATTMHKGYDPFNHKDILAFCKEVEAKYHLEYLEGEDRKQFKAIAPMYKYPALSIRGKLLGNVLGKARIECFKEMASNMELEKIIDSAIKKTVIFTSYVDVVKEAETYCRDKGYKPIIVNQETNAILPQLLEKAEKDPKANPIIATYKSLGTGNELVMCSSYVSIDVPFRDYIVIQSKARINRASQDTDVSYYDAVLDTGKDKNLSTRNLDILKWSKDQVDAMLGVKGDEIEDGEVEVVE